MSTFNHSWWGHHFSRSFLNGQRIGVLALFSRAKTKAPRMEYPGRLFLAALA
jgi:hypothetical protein